MLTRWRATSLLLALACGLGALLRLWYFTRTPPNPWYDAAVRSMSMSWHNFFFGAFEPGGSVSVDKAPVDLWIQVLSTKLLGFSSTALRLPQAIAGTLALPLLYDAVRRGFGRRAGVIAAFALAVMPVAVLSSRSDTMDTLMGTVLLAAAWVMVAAPPGRRSAAVVVAGAIAGLAFEVKLFEAAVALPGLAILGWALLDGPIRDCRRTMVRAGAAFVATASAWPVVASLAPGQHPWALGATDGSIWNVILIYNGVDRLGNSHSRVVRAAPSPIRLFTDVHQNYLAMVGVELLAAVLLGGAALLIARRQAATSHRMSARRRGRYALGAGIGMWVATGVLVFSVQSHLELRYFEAFTPAVAAAVGIGVTFCLNEAARAHRWRPRMLSVLTIVVVAAILTQPLLHAIDLGRRGAEDSQTLGARPPDETSRLGSYLEQHRAGAHYLFAASGSIIAGPLIVQNAQPVLMLTSWKGQAFTSLPRLEAEERAGQVRYLVVYTNNCRVVQDPYCPPVLREAVLDGTDVSSEAGLTPGIRLIRLN